MARRYICLLPRVMANVQLVTLELYILIADRAVHQLASRLSLRVSSPVASLPGMTILIALWRMSQLFNFYSIPILPLLPITQHQLAGVLRDLWLLAIENILFPFALIECMGVPDCGSDFVFSRLKTPQQV